MDYTTLVGAEEVRSAGHAMERAASEMNKAVSTLDHILNQHFLRMEELVVRLETLSKTGENHGDAAGPLGG